MVAPKGGMRPMKEGVGEIPVKGKLKRRKSVSHLQIQLHWLGVGWVTNNDWDIPGPAGRGYRIDKASRRASRFVLADMAWCNKCPMCCCNRHASDEYFLTLVKMILSSTSKKRTTSVL